MSIKLEYIRTPLHPYTFKNKKIKKWVEIHCEGKTLNLFAGKTKLSRVNEFRVDIDETANADIYCDALKYVRSTKEKYQTILLDPPYSYRKSMEKYNGKIMSPFKQLKDAIIRIIKPSGIVITFGYHSTSMGKCRGFLQEKILLIGHSGAQHDTIVIIERQSKKIKGLF